MGKRKIILLCAAVFLLAVYIFQVLSGRKTAVREIKIDGEITSIVIESEKFGEITLSKDGEQWNVGKYKANYKAGSIEEAIKTIKILDTVSSSVSDSAVSMYGLDSENLISVKAYSGESVLRALEIGKTSVTGSQTYVRIDGAKAVSLASGALSSTFGVEAESMRDNEIYSIASANIKRVSAKKADGTLLVAERSPSTDENASAVWTLKNENGDELDADSSKVSSWVSSVASLSADKWCDESDKSALDAAVTLEITTADKTVSVVVGEKGDDGKCTAESSESPYRFTLSPYASGNFFKTAADFLKQ